MQQGDEAAAAAAAAVAGVMMVVMVISLIISVFMIVALWKLFTKANAPGWAAIVPIYGMWVGAELAGKPGWWALLGLIPIVGVIIQILWSLAFAERFGKSTGFGIGIAFLPFVFLPILAFSDAEYSPPPPA